MHKLDPHTLFSIFEQGDEEIYKEHNVEDVLKNPYVLIGMVVTGIENFYFMDKMYSLKHPKHYGRVRDTIKNKYYNKLYRYLARLSPVEFDVIYKIGIDYELDKCVVRVPKLNRLLDLEPDDWIIKDSNLLESLEDEGVFDD